MSENAYLVVEDRPVGRPVDEALTEVFKAYGMERLGGATGAGWSSFSTLQRCPYLYRRRYIDQVRGTASTALEVGSCYHAFRALAAWVEINSADNSCSSVDWDALRGDLFAAGADPAVVAEAYRLNEAYEFRYETDYLTPLAVEEVGDYKSFTCRWDLIARVDDAQAGVAPGTYIVERKTSSRIDTSILDGWKSDGEIIGQVAIYQGGKYRKKWGKLTGIIVDVITKEKTPRFERLILPPQSWQVDQHLRDLKHWRKLKDGFARAGKWPRSRANCVTRYGLCPMFSECADGEGLDV